MARRSSAHPVLTPEVLRLIAARFRALGDASRLRVLNALMPGKRSVNELVRLTGLTQTTVSRHLGVLRRERVVERQADGRLAFYRIVDPTIDELCRIVCGGLGQQLARDLEALPRPQRWVRTQAVRNAGRLVS